MFKVMKKRFDGAELVMRRTDDGDMIFRASDIATAIGMSTSGARNRYRELDEDEKVRVSVGSGQATMFVTEAGMYKMILWSRASKKKGTFAHKFTRWVCHISKSGRRR